MSGGPESSGGRSSQRLQLACEPCRAAKLKCDRTIPVCEQCYKRSREAICKYTEKGLRYISVAQKAHSMKEKIERLELLVSRLKEPVALEAIASTASGVETTPPSGAEDVESPFHTGRIKLSRSGSTQWVGPSHWESIIDDLADVKAYFELQEAENVQVESGHAMFADDVPSVDVTLGMPHVFGKTDILDRLPSKVEMDRLVAAWFNIMDPARIMVHAPTFQQQYRGLWVSPSNIDTALLGLILAMTSLGAEISGQTTGDVATLAQAEYLGKLAAHTFVLADASKPQPHLIEALLLYIISLLYRHHDTTTQIWHIIGLAMRLCYQAGYHRDPSRNPNISRFDAEMRRRVWMVACELDISVSNTLGMISWINHDLCDTSYPSNLLDTDFSPTRFAAPRGQEECTLVQTEIAFTRVVLVLGDISASTHAVRQTSPAGIQALHARLVEAKSQLPQKLRMVPLDQCFIDSPFEVTDRLRIDFAYQRALCILYRRFLGMPECEMEHHRCLDAASTIVKHCIAMLEAAQPGGQLAALKVVLVRHIHDFILAAMLLCLELKRVSSSDGRSPRNSSDVEVRELLLRACHLWNTPGIPSTRAQVALNTILRFLTAGQYAQYDMFSEKQASRGTHSIGSSTFLHGPVIETPAEYAELQLREAGVLDSILDPNCMPGGQLDIPWGWSPNQDSMSGQIAPPEESTLDSTVTDGINGWGGPLS